MTKVSRQRSLPVRVGILHACRSHIIHVLDPLLRVSCRQGSMPSRPIASAVAALLPLILVGSALEVSAYVHQPFQQQQQQQRFATRAVSAASFRPPVPRGNSRHVPQTDNSRRHGQKPLMSSAAPDAVAFPTPSGERSSGNSSVGKRQLNKVQSALTKAGLLLFIVGMCMALPVALLPPHLAEKFGFIDRLKREQYALRAGCFCSRWLMRLIPFANISVYPYRKTTRSQACGLPTTPQCLIYFFCSRRTKSCGGRIVDLSKLFTGRVLRTIQSQSSYLRNAE